MSLNDKFGIIENHVLPEDHKKLFYKVDNYFENFLNSDIKVLIPGYVDQIFWFDKSLHAELISNIESQIKNYLIQRRNNMRSFIKKENFDIGNLNKFLKTFIEKLDCINSTMKLKDDKIIKEGVKQLSNLIISDSLILLFIEEQIVLFDLDNQSDFKLLLTQVKDLNKYDNNELYNKLLKTFGNAFKKYVFNLADPPLSDNVKRAHKLNSAIKYCGQMKKYFSFLSDVNDNAVFCCPVYHLIVDILTEIIRLNKISEIEFILNNCWAELDVYVFSNTFENKDQLIAELSREFINLIDKTLNGDINVLSAINILKFADDLIQNQTHKDLINQKVATILNSDGSNNLLQQIQQNIDNLVKNNKEKDAIKLLQFVSAVKDKDMLITQYYQTLIRRLLDFVTQHKNDKQLLCDHLKIEKKICEFMKFKFGDKLIYKINKVIYDIEVSIDDNSNFTKCITDVHDMLVITTSYNNWDVNQTEGLLDKAIVKMLENTMLGKYLTYYQQFYEIRYENKRQLNWFPHFGEVDITYLNQSFKMLPIQFMVLEMFNDVSSVNVNEIIRAPFFTNYSPKFVNDVIESLIVSGLVSANNTNIVLTTQLIPEKFTKNLVDVFFSSSECVSLWEQRRDQELAHSREEIVYANVNHLLKLKAIDVTELFEMAVRAINIFELDRKVFDKAIGHMCSMDYIKVEGTLCSKIEC